MKTIKEEYLNFKSNSFDKSKRKKYSKKNILHHYSKPKNYYNRLITFFTINSIILTLSLLSYEETWDFNSFILRLIIILLLMIILSAIIEFSYQSEYTNPIEIHNLEIFFKNFLESAYNDSDHYEKEHFNKYDVKTKKKFEKIFNIKHKYFLSSIKKKNNIYEITFINNTKLYEFFILKFLVKNAIHKAFVKKINNNYKIIGFE